VQGVPHRALSGATWDGTKSFDRYSPPPGLSVSCHPSQRPAKMAAPLTPTSCRGCNPYDQHCHTASESISSNSGRRSEQSCAWCRRKGGPNKSTSKRTFCRPRCCLKFFCGRQRLVAPLQVDQNHAFEKLFLSCTNNDDQERAESISDAVPRRAQVARTRRNTCASRIVSTSCPNTPAMMRGQTGDLRESYTIQRKRDHLAFKNEETPPTTKSGYPLSPYCP
jgi:hypothetical protein